MIAASVPILKTEIERTQADIARKRAAMLQAIESFSLAEIRLALLSERLERAEERNDLERAEANVAAPGFGTLGNLKR